MPANDGRFVVSGLCQALTTTNRNVATTAILARSLKYVGHSHCLQMVLHKLIRLTTGCSYLAHHLSMQSWHSSMIKVIIVSYVKQKDCSALENAV